MNMTDHQKTIFFDRYSKRNKENEPTETHPWHMWRRVADAMADNETEAQAFYEIQQDWRFVPGGRILAGAGTESEKTFYNCYVIPVETRARRKNRSEGVTLGVDRPENDAGADSREAIFDTIATMVDIMSRGGGVGINWSVLRPSGSYLTRISGTSSGPVGWMNVASVATGEVIQGGSRRGAAMFMLADWHPDVLNFIEAKVEAGKIENANISVAVSDDFMAAVRDGKTWQFRFPDTTHSAYNTEWDGDLNDWIAKGYPVKVYGRIDAKKMWALLAQSAWRSGEPGVVFLDRYNAQSTANGAEKIISVNPCGEQGLGAYSVCNLGSMNLAAYVTEVTGLSGSKSFHFDSRKFYKDVKVAVRFLDNVIDKTYYHLPETRKQQMKLRRIGLGVMGLADALIMLGMPYGSAAAVSWVEFVLSLMKQAAIIASMDIADEKGAAPAWKDSMWERPFLASTSIDIIERKPLRNLFLLTQAPTGTTSAVAGVNSGIEPYFAFEYTRKDRTGTHLMKSPIVDWAEMHGTTNALVTTADINGKQHLLMQAAVQNNLDSSVSKTVNFVKEATVEDVAEVYNMAYDLGLKGLAVYRDGSRDTQVLYRGEPSANVEEVSTLVHHPANGFDKAPLPVIAFAESKSGVCPDCGGSIVRQEGCSKCQSCSWSAC